MAFLNITKRTVWKKSPRALPRQNAVPSKNLAAYGKSEITVYCIPEEVKRFLNLQIITGPNLAICRLSLPRRPYYKPLAAEVIPAGVLLLVILIGAPFCSRTAIKKRVLST